MDYNLDIGANLTFLGLIFLGFKFLLPIIFGIVLLYAAYRIIKDKYPTLPLDQTTLFGILGIILVIFLLTR